MTVASEFEFEDMSTEEEWLNVEFYGDASVENDGIGSYEYWGFKGYDKGHNYFIVENITWDKSKYTEQQNQEINKYLENNWDEVHDQLCDVAEGISKDYI
jgi:hypothetical protein